MSDRDINYFNTLKTEDFKSEEEVYKTFEENLSLIFPNLIFVAHKYRPYQEGNEIDTVAWCKSRKSFVLIEYKNKSKSEDPVTQILGYRESLEIGDFYRLREIQGSKASTAWKRDIKNEKKNLILVCISPLNYFTNRQIAVAKANDIILIEFQRHERDIILIWCHFKNHLELLEWKNTYLIVSRAKNCKGSDNLALSIDKEKTISETGVNSKDHELLSFLKSLEVAEGIQNRLLEISANLFNSSFCFKRKLFSEGEWKGGINFYLISMRNISVIDIKLEQNKAVVWLRVVGEEIFIPPENINLEEGKWRNQWGKESRWKKYSLEDEKSWKKFYLLLNAYLNYLEKLSKNN